MRLTIERDPRVSFLVEEGERWAELQAVQINGHAEFVEDEDERLALRERAQEARHRVLEPEAGLGIFAPGGRP